MIYLAVLLSIAAIVAGIVNGQPWPAPVGNGLIVLLAFTVTNSVLGILARQPVRNGEPIR